MSDLIGSDLFVSAIAWDPEIRGILVVTVAALILCGSIYMLLATNNGPRLGALIALAGFFGWMTIMGFVWWIYGIGYVGSTPSWQIDEIVFGSLDQSQNVDVRQLDETDFDLISDLVAADPAAGELTGSQVPKSLSDIAGVNPELVDAVVSEEGATLLETDDGTVVGHLDADGNPVTGDPATSIVDGNLVTETGQQEPVQERRVHFDTGDWSVIEGADPFRGEAQAAADAALIEFVEGLEVGGYVPLGTFDFGGKPEASGDGIWAGVGNKVVKSLRLRHPVHHAVVQAAVVVPQEAVPGEAPPIPEIDPEQPVMSVVMTRDLGNERLPPALITLFSLGTLLLLSWMLHDRDRRIQQEKDKELNP